MKPSGNPTWSKTPITPAKLQAIEDALKSLENVAALPATGLAGRVVRLTTDKQLYLDDGAAWLRIFVADANGDLKLTGTSADPVKVILARSDGGATAKYWAVSIDAQHDMVIQKLNDDGTVAATRLELLTGGGANVDGSGIWTAGNDGAGSGLDADMVDTFHAGTAGGTEATKLAVTNASGRVGDSEKLGGETLTQVKNFAVAMALALG